ncbi:MAG: NAD(P)H-dependent amine dehydrogenase family protein [Acidimicrobiales bacterium]
MSTRVVVWGTGNVGQPAIRAVAAHRDLDLVGVVVANPAKVGRDAGELAGIGPLGVACTDDAEAVLSAGVDAVVYTASGDFRPVEAEADLEQCLRAGANVTSTSFYGLLHPPSCPPALRRRVDDACAEGQSSVFVSGIDPGWALDLLPLVLSGVVADITEIRAQEIFNYATYDQPDAVRDLIGFGRPLSEVPPMLLPTIPTSVWGPMLRVLADGLGVELDDIVEAVDRRPLERTIDVDGMGRFEEGTQGAFRMELKGMVDGQPLLVVDHVTRIDDDVVPEWPRPSHAQGVHQVLISGRPHLSVTIHGDDGDGVTAGGGNATAANRIVNTIPAVCAAPPGPVHPLDLPFIDGRSQLRGVR